MRLIRAHVRNFKLLEDVQVEFSTKRDRPLTVIRAENGSGKTSLLYAFQWAFYGMAGLPAVARSLRLTSTAASANVSTPVSVTIEFEYDDDYGTTARYRLVRSVVETPTKADEVDRETERVRLLKITSAGEEDLTAPESWINRWLPQQLRDVFFTDGDSVQTFISAEIGERQRQVQVQNAIRNLLGIERFRVTETDLKAVFRNLRLEAAKSGGVDTADLETSLAATDARIDGLQETLERLRKRQANMAGQRATWDNELGSLRGIGDIDEINDRIDRVTSVRDRLESERSAGIQKMQVVLRSEEYSWMLVGEQLRTGLGHLEDLADRRIIPGASVEVLVDRLGIDECICGQSLAPGTEHRAHVEQLLAQQRSVSDHHQRLTGLSYVARQAAAEERSRIEAGRAFQQVSAELLQQFTAINDELRAAGVELTDLERRRSQIDATRVHDLVASLADVEAKIAKVNRDVGAAERDLAEAEGGRSKQDQALKQAQNEARVSLALATRRDVAEDLANLATDVLEVLQHDYVGRVSARMGELFMEIVGAPDRSVRADFGTELYAGVRFDDDYNIVIDTAEGRRLDPDFELNGASKRALTLSFIWALMEVSGATAPRMIDTPLGMVSGGVKHRMVDAITMPPADGARDFQVILFLTRAELRDVEDLVDERAGSTMTLSCSEHYPTDLIHPWHVDYPVSRICACDHRHSCRLCARRYDERHGVRFRETEVGAP